MNFDFCDQLNLLLDENKYKAEATALGRHLSIVTNKLLKDDSYSSTLSKEFFFQLAEQLIIDQDPICKHFKAINTLKNTTKKDIYHRLLIGKDYIDTMFTHHLLINDISRVANLSEYYFYRLFKSVFKTSPYKYIIKKRLELAKELILSGNMTITDIAIQTGFSDVQSFSNAFKKHYGSSPSCFVKQ